MTAQPPDHSTPPVPQPPATPEALRTALARIAPHRLTDFDAARATDAARAQTNAGPLRRFAEQWAVEVAIERHPSAAAELRELEARATTEEDPGLALAIANRISQLRNRAATEAGILRAGAAQ